MPKVRHLYFVLTKGRGRIISKAEIFGRLNFCGFQILSETYIKERLYFVARKIKTVSSESQPSYGLLVQLKRIGLKGETIEIHKFRTMHPYSEFLQEYLYKNSGLNPDGDKILNDYRVTKWGQILRKSWIDEIPQIYNWLRGDLSLVGVRALSKAKFDIYPDDLKRIRTRFKPGLVPPFYADIPKTFDEFMDSERRYLHKKEEKPFITDIIYFSKAFVNIVFKGTRSG